MNQSLPLGNLNSPCAGAVHCGQLQVSFGELYLALVCLSWSRGVVFTELVFSSSYDYRNVGPIKLMISFLLTILCLRRLVLTVTMFFVAWLFWKNFKRPSSRF